MIVKEKALSECAGKESEQENVKKSNFYYEKIMIQKACHCAFSLLVLTLQLKASYMRYDYSKREGGSATERIILDDRVK